MTELLVAVAVLSVVGVVLAYLAERADAKIRRASAEHAAYVRGFAEARAAYSDVVRSCASCRRKALNVPCPEDDP